MKSLVSEFLRYFLFAFFPCFFFYTASVDDLYSFHVKTSMDIFRFDKGLRLRLGILIKKNNANTFGAGMNSDLPLNEIIV